MKILKREICFRSDYMIIRMSASRWTLCFLLCLLMVMVCNSQDQSNTSAQYLFSSIRDLRLHQQQQHLLHPRRNPFQHHHASSSQPSRQTLQDSSSSHNVPITIRKSDRTTENGIESQQLKSLRRNHNKNMPDSSAEGSAANTQLQSATQRQHPPPPLDLTRGELAHMYQAAVRKGNTVRLGADGAPIQAAVHHLDDGEDGDQSNHHEGDNRGYYYYYYPLKSFMHELSSPNNNSDNEQQNNKDYFQVAENSYHNDVDDMKSHLHDSPHVYEHMHQHNVHIEPMKTDMDTDKKSKGLEPLFMAISGFIGMTVMFIISMLMMPKLGHVLKSRHRTKTEDEADVMRVVMKALDGEDCRERLACEMGKAANALNLYDNRLVKFVRRIGPVSIRRRIDKIGKYTDKKFKCAAIQCKRKMENQSPNVV